MGDDVNHVSFKGSRRSYLEGYKLIEEEENQIFELVLELEPVRELVLEEEEDDF